MTVEDFSAGYYRINMEIQPMEEGPVIEQGLYNRINKVMYARTDTPPTVRLDLGGGPIFRPDPEPGIPRSMMGLPRSWLDDMEIYPDKLFCEREYVFILKPAHAYLLKQAEILGKRFTKHNINENRLEEEKEK